MITAAIESKLLRNIEYDPERKELYATFHSGKLYAYKDVPLAVWQQLIQAPSVGSHFLKNIKPKFQCYPLGTAPEKGAAA